MRFVVGILASLIIAASASAQQEIFTNKCTVTGVLGDECDVLCPGGLEAVDGGSVFFDTSGFPIVSGQGGERGSLLLRQLGEVVGELGAQFLQSKEFPGRQSGAQPVSVPRVKRISESGPVVEE